MAVQDQVLQLTGRLESAEKRQMGIPWWAIVLAIAVTILSVTLWATPVLADSGGVPVSDEIPVWVIIAMVVGSLVGVRGLTTSYRR